MKFDNAFEIPLPVNEAWKVLLDVPRIAPCMPGAELTAVENENTYKGKVSVRLGPVALTFAGRAQIEEIDEANHRARIKAQGVDAKGRGGANAVVDFELRPSALGSNVLVHTDLMLSGSVAQYGRGTGMIHEVAAQLMNQFADSLSAKLTVEGVLAAPGAGPQQGMSPTAPAAVKSISGMSLLFRAMWNVLWRALRGGRRPNSHG